MTQGLRRRRTEAASQQSWSTSKSEDDKSAKKPSNEEEENQVDVNDVNECVHMVDSHIVESLRAKVERNVVNPMFMASLDYALAPLERILEKKFCKDFNDLKKCSLALGEYKKRYKENPEEAGDKHNAIKEFLESELNSLGFNSPIAVVNVDDMTKSTITLFTGGKERTFDMSKKQDKDDLKALIGGKKVLLLPGSPLRISRPTWFSYVMSIDVSKPMNELELNMVVDSLKRRTKCPVCIKVQSEDGEVKTIGEESEGGVVLMMKHELAPDGQKTGHFVPVVMRNGKTVEIQGLTNVGKACGAESLLFLFKVIIIFSLFQFYD